MLPSRMMTCQECWGVCGDNACLPTCLSACPLGTGTACVCACRLVPVLPAYLPLGALSVALPACQLVLQLQLCLLASCLDHAISKILCCMLRGRSHQEDTDSDDEHPPLDGPLSAACFGLEHDSGDESDVEAGNADPVHLTKSTQIQMKVELLMGKVLETAGACA